jgi:hypothetical protein
VQSSSPKYTWWSLKRNSLFPIDLPWIMSLLLDQWLCPMGQWLCPAAHFYQLAAATWSPYWLRSQGGQDG